MAQVIGRTQHGGKLIEVLVPIAICELARELTDLIDSKELSLAEGKERWLSQVQPHVIRGLSGMTYHETMDVIVLKPDQAIRSTQKPQTPQILPPSALRNDFLSQHLPGGIASFRRGPLRLISKKGGP